MLLLQILRKEILRLKREQIDIYDQVETVVDILVAVNQLSHPVDAGFKPEVLIRPFGQRAVKGNESVCFLHHFKHFRILGQFMFRSINEKCMHPLSLLSKSRFAGSSTSRKPSPNTLPMTEK